MSNSYDTEVSAATIGGSTGSPGTLDTAKDQAAELTRTATEQAKGVVGTAKDEASSVVHEAKDQVGHLYAQTRQELSDQARTQQQRLATGMRSVSDELGTMADNGESDGLAAGIVRQVSDRLSGAATWLGDRDPASVLQEVKRFARRKPGTFIFGAVVAGVVVGRLTRALAANASEEAKRSQVSGGPSGNGFAAATPVTSPPNAARPVAAAGETPIFAQSAGEHADAQWEAGDERPHSL